MAVYDADAEVEHMARDMVARYGANAAREAVDRLNEMIDANNIPERDLWACVVHAIHRHQGAVVDPAGSAAGCGTVAAGPSAAR